MPHAGTALTKVGAVGLANHTVTIAAILTALENKKKAAEEICNIRLKKTNDARKSKNYSFLNPSIHESSALLLQKTFPLLSNHR